MRLESSAFNGGQPIPERYTCDGEDVSPPLQISDVPKGCKSLAMFVDDPDAPVGTFDHWIVWNLHPKTNDLAEGVSLPHEGENGFGTVGWRGPCPPRGSPHRYFFRLYALDTMLPLREGSNREEVEEAMEGHILEKAELMGTYRRK
ncbi:YbhB/YbcL family Raf kinase inhibitor-like protein [Estrella lausannensis]|uniref:PEBP family protein n=1 Tax=Estrella lausannensis TaxID=483423 RepID=A0A0H5DSC7_9BACT|nr:YbhB/YbcL family Raf kinase inhibitor-like protein [Estrella lausannensis]CRX38664.1 PEBP family protein [Estrella lausannensis]